MELVQIYVRILIQIQLLPPVIISLNFFSPGSGSALIFPPGSGSAFNTQTRIRIHSPGKCVLFHVWTLVMWQMFSTEESQMPPYFDYASNQFYRHERFHRGQVVQEYRPLSVTGLCSYTHNFSHPSKLQCFGFVSVSYGTGSEPENQQIWSISGLGTFFLWSGSEPCSGFCVKKKVSPAMRQSARLGRYHTFLHSFSTIVNIVTLLRFRIFMIYWIMHLPQIECS